MKKILSGKWAAQYAGLSPFILRIIFGYGIFLRGWMKLTTMHISGFSEMLGSLNIPLPMFFAGLVIWVEILGGAALILGIFTRFAAKLLAIVMIVAILSVHIKNGFLGELGFEIPLLYLTGFISLMLTGAGKWSLESE